MAIAATYSSLEALKNSYTSALGDWQGDRSPLTVMGHCAITYLAPTLPLVIGCGRQKSQRLDECDAITLPFRSLLEREISAWARMDRKDRTWRHRDNLAACAEYREFSARMRDAI